MYKCDGPTKVDFDMNVSYSIPLDMFDLALFILSTPNGALSAVALTCMVTKVAKLTLARSQD